MNHIEKIRAALEQAGEYIRSDLASERGAFEGYEGVSRIDEIKADLANNKSAIAALAELERSAAAPVAWMWNDDLGIPHASAGSKKPVWLESSASAEYIKQANLRPLYAAPPAPVAEIREAVITDEMGKKVYEKWIRLPRRIDRSFAVSHGIDMIAAVRAELGPALGLVELKEPTPEDGEAIYKHWERAATGCRPLCQSGRDMFDAVRAVMWPKEGL